MKRAILIFSALCAMSSSVVAQDWTSKLYNYGYSSSPNPPTTGWSKTRVVKKVQGGQYSYDSSTIVGYGTPPVNGSGSLKKAKSYTDEISVGDKRYADSVAQAFYRMGIAHADSGASNLKSQFLDSNRKHTEQINLLGNTIVVHESRLNDQQKNLDTLKSSVAGVDATLCAFCYNNPKKCHREGVVTKCMNGNDYMLPGLPTTAPPVTVNGYGYQQGSGNYGRSQRTPFFKKTGVQVASAVCLIGIGLVIHNNVTAQLWYQH